MMLPEKGEIELKKVLQVMIVCNLSEFKEVEFDGESVYLISGQGLAKFDCSGEEVLKNAIDWLEKLKNEMGDLSSEELDEISDGGVRLHRLIKNQALRKAFEDNWKKD